MWLFGSIRDMSAFFHRTNLSTWSNYRPHPKDGEGNVFTLSTPGGGGGSGPAGRGGVRSSSGGGVRSSCRGGRGSGSKVNPAGGGLSGWKVNPAGGGGVRVKGQSSWGRGVRSSWRGGGIVRVKGQSRQGGVRILRHLAGGMPLAFTQEDFLVEWGCYRSMSQEPDKRKTFSWANNYVMDFFQT